MEFTHEAYSVFKPNPVQPKSAKGTNIGGLIGYRLLGIDSTLVLNSFCVSGFGGVLNLFGSNRIPPQYIDLKNVSTLSPFEAAGKIRVSGTSMATLCIC